MLYIIQIKFVQGDVLYLRLTHPKKPLYITTHLDSLSRRPLSAFCAPSRTFPCSLILPLLVPKILRFVFGVVVVDIGP